MVKKMSNNNVYAKDIYGQTVSKASAASVGKFDGTDIWIPKQHETDAIDKIVKEYGQGTGYAKWQKERYPVRVDIPLLQARMMGVVDSDGYVINAKLAKVFK